ncbi:MAG: glycosyltransferase family 4 protein [Cytophagaceae bacterium]
MARSKNKFIVLHLGSRIHYELPASLSVEGKLKMLITDAWVRPGSIFALIIHLLPFTAFKKLSQRYNKTLSTSNVISFNLSVLIFEFWNRIKGKKAWNLVLARNTWFQKKCLEELQKIADENITVIAFSYTALEPFRYAKSRGWKTVLFQIDAGETDNKIVTEIYRNNSQYNSNFQNPPDIYWEKWKEELQLSDVVIANSDFTASALMAAGLSKEKIKIVPLSVKISESHENFTRIFPSRFDIARPLRLLFLGNLSLRKGLHVIFELIELVEGLPVEFYFVGSKEVELPVNFQTEKVKWVDSVSRIETYQFYQQSDVFIFPTFSDGFGLTQLEAMSWRLPVIASENCAKVVEHGRNGFLLKDLTAAELQLYILEILNAPGVLKFMSEEAFVTALQFNSSRFGREISDALEFE